jgi:hypothetical protein
MADTSFYVARVFPLPENAPLRELLARGRGVLALPGGGCARYVFCEDVAYRRDPAGRLWVTLERGNDSYRDLLQRSGLNLQIVAARNPDQSEALLLVVCGQLAAPDGTPEQRLHLRAAYLEAESGERTALPLAALELAAD